MDIYTISYLFNLFINKTMPIILTRQYIWCIVTIISIFLLNWIFSSIEDLNSTFSHIATWSIIYTIGYVFGQYSIKHLKSGSQ
jgi:hypothetical protein